MNNKGQMNAIIVFAIVVLMLIFVAPILMKIVVAPVEKVSQAFTNVDPTNRTSNEINFIQDKFTGTFDWIIAFLFMFNTLILLVSAFLVDVHPAFLVIYIIAVLFLMIFAPTVLDAVGNIYDNAAFTSDLNGGNNVIQYLPITEFIYDNFGVIMVGIIVMSGIIIFGKYRLGRSSGSGTGGVY